MIGVIFEVEPLDGKLDEYLAIAAELRPLLDEIDGFISVERFQSLTQPGKYLSLSFFRDEDAVLEWRALAEHRGAQRSGRENLFNDYRIRVAHVMRDYSMHDRKEVPTDSLNALS